jgi:hypothetical protein
LHLGWEIYLFSRDKNGTGGHAPVYSHFTCVIPSFCIEISSFGINVRGCSDFYYPFGIKYPSFRFSLQQWIFLYQFSHQWITEGLFFLTLIVHLLRLSIYVVSSYIPVAVMQPSRIELVYVLPMYDGFG